MHYFVTLGWVDKVQGGYGGDDDDDLGLFDDVSDEIHMFEYSSERLRHNDGNMPDIWNCAKPYFTQASSDKIR